MAINYSANMTLPIPGVGNEAGPNYAVDINACMTLIDSHDHSSGRGVPITPNGLNINSSLTFQNNAATNVSLVNLTSGGAITSPLVSLYANGDDLYFLDGAGNQVRITQSGAVAGSPGSISNLEAPASASYVAVTRTFVWQSDTNIAANLDAASILLRNLSPNSTYAVTLSAPAALASNYSVTLPLPPVAQALVTMAPTGIQGTTIPDGNTITFSGGNLIVPSGGINTTQLANNAVTTDKILDEAVTFDKLNPDAQLIARTQDFTTSGSFVVPENVHWINALMCGGGGGGGAGCGDGGGVGGGWGGGAGGGGSIPKLFSVKVTPGETIAVTIGAGGAGGTPAFGAGGNGANGGTTSISGTFGTYIVTGGLGGAGGSARSGAAGVTSTWFATTEVSGSGGGGTGASPVGSAGAGGESNSYAVGGAGGPPGDASGEEGSSGGGGGGGAGFDTGGTGGKGAGKDNAGLTAGAAGSKGSGGGGGGGGNNAGGGVMGAAGGAGGNGFVRITWSGPAS